MLHTYFFKKDVFIKHFYLVKRYIYLYLYIYIYIYILWGPIDPIGTIHLEKGWAYGPIPSPRIRAYPRTIS